MSLLGGLAVFSLKRQSYDELGVRSFVYSGIRNDVFHNRAKVLDVLALDAELAVIAGWKLDVEPVALAVGGFESERRTGAEYLSSMHHYHGIAQHVGLVQVMGG